MKCIKHYGKQPSTVAMTHSHGLWFWCQQDTQLRHKIHRAGIIDPSDHALPWADTCRIHLVLQPQHMCHGSLLAKHPQERPHLAAKAKLAACAQLDTDPEQLWFDYQIISAYQLHWYAAKACHVERCQAILGKQHRLTVIEPCSYAMQRAVQQLVPNGHDQATMVLLTEKHHMHLINLPAQHTQPPSCTAMSPQQCQRYIDEHEPQPWLHATMQTLITPDHTTSDTSTDQPTPALQTLLDTLPKHLKAKLPRLATLAKQANFAHWQDLTIAPLLALYGAMIRKSAYGH